MTNPDNVGGLPELPEPEYPADDEFVDGMKTWPAHPDYYTADQMRAYGELCRAAPAGGDSLRALVKELRESLEGVVRVADRNTDEFDRAREAIARASHVFVNAGDSEAQFIADGENLDCPACGGSGHAGDSAPAGSGEVMDSWQKWPIINRLQMQANDCEDAADMESDAVIMPLQLKALATDLREAAALLRKLQQGAESKPKVGIPVEVLDRVPGQPDDEVWLMQDGKCLGKFKVAASQGQEGGNVEG